MAHHTRFRVREQEVPDPHWAPEQALDLWRRMLAARLQALAQSPPAPPAPMEKEAPA